ncbi:hypothetical protein [Halobellus sp. GM3]|uniref:hypothetical protein n=1 Tax=Halobellus sp. GM3 TaxID=3458410 RepID=UPI00403DB59E
MNRHPRDALEEVVDAALERALLEESDARRHFALAGALVRVRSEATATAAIGAEDPPGSSPLAAVLVSTAAVSALDTALGDETGDRGIDASVWIPDGTQPDSALVESGARAASRRFDVDRDRIAALADVSREILAVDGDERRTPSGTPQSGRRDTSDGGPK